MESSLPQAVPAYSWVPWNLLLNGLNSDCFVDYCPVKHYDDENKHWIFPSRYQALGSWLWPRLKCYWQQFGEFPTPPWQYLPLLSLSASFTQHSQSQSHMRISITIIHINESLTSWSTTTSFHWSRSLNWTDLLLFTSYGTFVSSLSLP